MVAGKASWAPLAQYMVHHSRCLVLALPHDSPASVQVEDRGLGRLPVRHVH